MSPPEHENYKGGFMSTDIECHFEIKIEGRWEHYLNPDYIGNSYALFYKMSGDFLRGGFDRDSIEPVVCVARGLPGDISGVTRLNSYIYAGHSHSWLNASETVEVINFHKSIVSPAEVRILPPHPRARCLLFWLILGRKKRNVRGKALWQFASASYSAQAWKAIREGFIDGVERYLFRYV
jgi:hypothetical protein